MNNDKALADWYKDDGDNTFCVRHPLTENSLVLDVGGYEGNWSEKIVKNYNPFICIFEPVKKAHNIAKNKFQNNPKVQVFNFGLSNHTGEVKISLKGDGSCIWNLESGVDTEMICIKDIVQVLTFPIDLISINIEGEEYNLLSHMIVTGIVRLCRRIQVQFHNNYSNCDELRRDIREKLQETHDEIYNYPFVWECWEIK